MSSLGSGKNKEKLLSIIKEPSPICPKCPADPARNPKSSQISYNYELGVKSCFLKGTSLFAALSRKAGGGMTVEASIVLPLFLFFFLNLGCAMEMIRLHGNIQLAVWEIGSRLSVYGYALDSGEMPEGGEQDDDWWRDLAGIAVSSTVIKRKITDSVGGAYLDQSPLTDGTGGLQLWESSVFGSGDEIDILVTYSVSPWSSLVGISPFRMSNRYYSHIWNGYDLAGGGNQGDVQGTSQTVYVTDTGTVYHLSDQCSYLNLSVSQVPAGMIEGERNQNGGKYYPCSRCAGGNGPLVLFITRDGDRYHYDRKCSGLKRTIHTMAIEKAMESGYAPCSRCGH